jgi:N-acetylglucosamine-6-sulfatase
MFITKVLRLLVVGLVLNLGGLAFAQPPATQPGARRGGRGPAAPGSTTQPVLQRGTNNRHAQFLEIAKKGDIDLLFVGDSITDFWQRPGPRYGQAIWDKYFVPLKAADFGISADRTEHVLFRLQNGELEGFKAKCIVLMIGTNNLDPNGARNTPEDTILGVQAVVAEIRKRQPDAKLLLLGIFPRANKADDPFRPLIKQVNTAISKLDDGKSIFYMDIGAKFLAADGTLTPEIMPDYLHPNEKGYEIWAEAIIGKVKQLMGQQQ